SMSPCAPRPRLSRTFHRYLVCELRPVIAAGLAVEEGFARLTLRGTLAAPALTRPQHCQLTGRRRIHELHRILLGEREIHEPPRVVHLDAEIMRLHRRLERQSEVQRQQAIGELEPIVDRLLEIGFLPSTCAAVK